MNANGFGFQKVIKLLEEQAIVSFCLRRVLWMGRIVTTEIYAVYIGLEYVIQKVHLVSRTLFSGVVSIELLWVDGVIMVSLCDLCATQWIKNNKTNHR